MSVENGVGLVVAVLLAVFLVRAAVPGAVLMSETVTGVVFVPSLVLVLVLLHRPVGSLLHAIATLEHDLAGGRLVHRPVGVDARAEQS